MDRDGEDLFLSKKALDRKLLTPQQLREALMEQSRAPAGAEPPRLSEILLARGFLSAEQLAGLENPLFSPAASGRDSSLGRLLLSSGKLRPEQLKECVRLQEDALRDGAANVPRLGELLVQKGYVSPDAVRQALAQQEKTILACRSCGQRCNASAFDPARKYLCPACRGELRPVSDGDEHRVQESTREIPPESKSERILGKYTIVREIGRGGMGVVFEALDSSRGQTVALKMLALRPTVDPKIVAVDEERFLREAKLGRNLPKHPHIVGVHEAGVIDGNRYLAMEFINGVPMNEWWKDKAIRLRTQIAVLRDAALAAHHAHGHGVIHRDLKPENILIDAEGQPHITDFGLAKETGRNPKEQLTGLGMVVGSPHYMSPEQAQGLRSVDHRTDVYSLGVILYEMFTGRRPFEGGSPTEIMLNALKGEARSPSTIMRNQINPVNHRALECICFKALAKNVKERYPSAKALAEDLTRWLDGQEVLAERPGKLRRKKQLLSAGIAAGALLVVGFLAIALFSGAPTIERELALAAELVRDRNYPSARAVYDRILVRTPGQKQALTGKLEIKRRIAEERTAAGDRFLREKKYSEAFDAFSFALIEDPTQTRAIEGRDLALRHLGGPDARVQPR